MSYNNIQESNETDIANKIVTVERLQDIDNETVSNSYKLICDIIKKSFWDKHTSELGHSLTRIQLVNNLELNEQYENHKKERKHNAKLCERILYFVCFDEEQAIDISNNGFKCRKQSDCNFLGDSSQGIHFSKHLDILLKYEYSKQEKEEEEEKHQNKKLFCIMTKAFYDVEKLKTIKVNYDNQQQIEASSQHDGHVACLNLLCSNNVNSNLASKLVLKNYYMETLIFLYGLDESLKSIQTPKNILPYAILKYEIKNPHVFNRKLIKPRQNISNLIIQESDACRLVKNFRQETESTSITSNVTEPLLVDELKLFEDFLKMKNANQENETKMPKWRIIYERTGNLNTIFYGSRRMECRLNNVKHLGLKYVNDEKSILNVSNPTNKFILQYHSKRIKKNITTATTNSTSDETPTDFNVKYIKKCDLDVPNVKSMLRIGPDSYLHVNFSYIPVNRVVKIKTELNEPKNVKVPLQTNNNNNNNNNNSKSSSLNLVNNKSAISSKPLISTKNNEIKQSAVIKSNDKLLVKKQQPNAEQTSKKPLSLGSKSSEELKKKQQPGKEESSIDNKNKSLTVKKAPSTSISSDNILQSKPTIITTTISSTKSVTNLITSRPQAKEVIKNVFEKNRSKVSTNTPANTNTSTKLLSSQIESNKKIDLTEKLIESIKNSSKRKKSFWDPDSDTEYGKMTNNNNNNNNHANNPYNSLSIKQQKQLDDEDEDDYLDDDIVIVSKQNLNMPPIQYSKQFYDSNINGFESELKKFSPAYISSSTSSSPSLYNNTNTNTINNSTVTTITKSPIKHKKLVPDVSVSNKRMLNHRLVNRQRYIHHITVNNIINTTTSLINNKNNNDFVINQIDVDCLKNLKSNTIEIHAAGFRCIEEHNFQQSVNYLRRTKSLESKSNHHSMLLLNENQFTKIQSFSNTANDSLSNNNNKKISLNDYVSTRCNSNSSKSATTTPASATTNQTVNTSESLLLLNNIKKEPSKLEATTSNTVIASNEEEEQQQQQKQPASLSLIDEVKKRINANRNELKEELYSNQSLIKQDDLYDDDELKKIQYRHLKQKRQKKKQEKSKQKKIKIIAEMSDNEDDSLSSNIISTSSSHHTSSSSSFKSSDLLLSDNDDDADSSLSSLSSLSSSTSSTIVNNKKHDKKRKITDLEETNDLNTNKKVKNSTKSKKKKSKSSSSHASSSGSNPINEKFSSSISTNNNNNINDENKLIPTKDDDYSIEIGDINLDEITNNNKNNHKQSDQQNQSLKLIQSNNNNNDNNYDNFYSEYDIEDSNILENKKSITNNNNNKSESPIQSKSINQQNETPKQFNTPTPIIANNNNNLTPNNQLNKIIMTPKTAPPSLSNQPRRFQNNNFNTNNNSNNNNSYYNNNNQSYVSPINPRNSSHQMITPPLPIPSMPIPAAASNYPNKMQRLNRSVDYSNNNIPGSYPFNNAHGLDHQSPSNLLPNMNNYLPTNFYQTVMNQMSYANGNQQQQITSQHHYNNYNNYENNNDYSNNNNNYPYYNNFNNNNNNYQRQGNIKEKNYNNNSFNQNYNQPRNQQRNFNNNNNNRINNNNINRQQYQLNNNNQQRSSIMNTNPNNNKRAQNPDQEDGEIVD